MKDKNKGFTLVELLAVIVILGSILAIAVPAILDVVERSKRETSIESGQLYVNAVNKYMNLSTIDSSKYEPFIKTNQTVYSIDDMKNVKVKNKPSKGNVKIIFKKVIKADLCINEYNVTYDEDGKPSWNAVKSEKCGFNGNIDDKYTLKADSQGGEIKELDGWTLSSDKKTATKSFNYANTYGELPIAEKNGYVFEGWYTDKDGGEKVDNNTYYDVAIDQTIYAHYISAPVIEGGSDKWVSEKTKIKVKEFSKSNTGIVKYQYYISSSKDELKDGKWLDCEKNNQKEASQTFDENMQKYIFFRAVSLAGVYSNPSNYQEVKIDKVTPFATITGYKAGSSTEVASGTWSEKGLNFIFKDEHIAHGESNYKIYYCGDRDNSCNPDENTNIYKEKENDDEKDLQNSVNSDGKITRFSSTNGTFYIRYKIVSEAGKESNVITYIAYVDSIVPSATVVAYKTGNGDAEVSSGDWSDKYLNYIFYDKIGRRNITAGPSGYDIYYCIDYEDKCEPSNANVVGSNTSIIKYSTNPPSHSYYFRYKIVNKLGVSSSIKTFVARVDTVVPSATITAYKNGNGDAEVASGKWSDTRLNFYFKDSNKITGASDGTIKYCFDRENKCTPAYEYSNMFQKTEEEIYYIRYKITSGAGVSSNIKTYTAKVDTVTPKTELFAYQAGTDGNVHIKSDTWYSKGLSFNFDKTKTTSGPSNYTIYYCFDRGKNGDNGYECVPGPNTHKYENKSIVDLNDLDGIYFVRYKIISGAGKSSTGVYTAKISIPDSSSGGSSGGGGSSSSKCYNYTSYYGGKIPKTCTSVAPRICGSPAPSNCFKCEVSCN